MTKYRSRNNCQVLFARNSPLECCAQKVPDTYISAIAKLADLILHVTSVAGIVSGLALGIFATEQVPPTLAESIVAANRNDAGLNAVFVLSPDRVWAVGDRGQILATDNGGIQWQPQLSGTAMNLYAIYFVDAQRGWCVGGSIDPVTRESTGIVLTTQDGGNNWRSHVPVGLPRLIGIARSDQGRWFAWGDYSPHLGACKFESGDGVIWQAIETTTTQPQVVGWNRAGECLTVDWQGFANVQSVRRAGRAVRIAKPTEPIRAVTYDGGIWYAVGSQGSVLLSTDASSWQSVEVPLAAPARHACQWNCLATYGDNIWIAGYPGSITLRSTDRGRTWRTELNRYPVPRNCVSFADANRGWAVAPNGAILATRDGGVNWFIQRQSWQQLAVLSVVGREEDVPWPALIATSWEHRQASASIAVHANPVMEGSDFAPTNTTVVSQLAPQFGVAVHTTWTNYPLTSQHTASAAELHNCYQDSGQPSAFEIDLAVACQAWQPSVLLTNSSASSNFADRALAQAVQRGVRLADQHSFPALGSISSALGLHPWRPAKIVELTDANHSKYSILDTHILRDSGISVLDVMRPLVSVGHCRPNGAHMRTIPEEHLNSAAYDSMFGGVALGAESGRRVNLESVGNYQLVVARSQRELSIRRLLEQSENAVGSHENWCAQLEFLLSTVPKHDLIAILVSVADQCMRQRHWKRARYAMSLLADSTATHEVHRRANFQAAKLLGSDEICAWLNALDSSHSFDTESHRSESQFATTAEWKETPFEGAVVSAAATVDSAAQTPVRFSNFEARVPELKAIVANPLSDYVVDLATSLARLRRTDVQDPSLCKRPDKLLLQYSRMRRVAEFAVEPTGTSAEKMEILAGQLALHGYAQAAEQELQLSSGRIGQLRTSVKAVRAVEAPLLDGELNDQLWSRAPVLELGQHAGTEGPATRIRFGYDDRFLYIAVQCPRRQAVTGDHKSPKRRYDTDLVGTDHLHFMIDTDRDYVTTQELGINEFGETFDRCGGFAEWNPAWYRAMGNREGEWLAEAAISLKDLTLLDDIAGRAWAISVYRFVPQFGMESWSNARFSNPVPHGGGLLLIEP